jgi:hypothetical protein
MPVPALSLLGFMPQKVAMHYLQHDCFGYNSSQRRPLYEAAVARLGVAMPKAGDPEILPIPVMAGKHLADVMGGQQFRLTIQGFHAFEFALVEIDPLLAFQWHVSVQRAEEVDRVPRDDSPEALTRISQ